MDRATFKHLMGIGVLLNSALYLAGCLIAGLVQHNAVAWRLALIALGVTYLSYCAHFAADHDAGDNLARAAFYLVWTSVAFGALAGFALLFR